MPTSTYNIDDSDERKRRRRRKNDQLTKASTLSLAPMMEYTDRHFRHLIRLLSSQTLLYTEMVAANTLVYERAGSIKSYQERHPDATEIELSQNYDGSYLNRFLGQSGIRVPPVEGASVLQLGGSDPEQLHAATKTVMEMTDRGFCDYTAINLNAGCPSPKVAGKGCFGAALMDNPKLVAEVVKAMDAGCQGQIPITVKCRIGTDTQETFYKDSYSKIDEKEEYSRLCQFVETVASTGVVTDFTVHARIAVLSRNFSPADNRKIPPLKYHFIQQLVKDYPDFTFSLNGGIEDLTQVKEQLDLCPGLKGVMVGRAFAANPWSFAIADRLLYGKDGDKDTTPLFKNRLEVLEAYGKHADDEEARNDPSKIRRFLVKAITPLFAGEKNSKQYRIALNEVALLAKKGSSLEVQPPISELILKCATEHLSEEVLLRSREESYEQAMYKRERGGAGDGMSRSAVVEEWQNIRKTQSHGSYERMLAEGIDQNQSSVESEGRSSATI